MPQAKCIIIVNTEMVSNRKSGNQVKFEAGEVASGRSGKRGKWEIGEVLIGQ